MRACGALAELSFADLRFTSQEAEDLLGRLVGSTPASEDLSRLLAHTEGWATGLVLAALGLQTYPIWALLIRGDISYKQGQRDLAREQFEQAARLARELNIASSIAAANRKLDMLANEQHSPDS